MKRSLFWKAAFLVGYALALAAFWLAAARGAEPDGERLTRTETEVGRRVPEYRSEYVRVVGPNASEIGRRCDAIVRALEERYGTPEYWRVFPVRYAPNLGGAVAGYTEYVEPNVTEVAIFQTFDESVGATLDHELTHAFFFYYLHKNFDLMLNEGLAQHSEYASRSRLRELVCARYRAGEFAPLAALYGSNRYDRTGLIYTEGFGVVDFLVARGGSKWFAAFMLDLTRETDDIDLSLRRFYGYASLDELEEDWLEFVRGGQDCANTRAVALPKEEKEK